MYADNDLHTLDYLGDAAQEDDPTVVLDPIEKHRRENSVKKGFFRRHRVAVICAAVVLVGGGIAVYKLAFAQKSTTKTVYQYETVKQGTLTDTISGTGSVAVRHEVSVNSSVSGTVKSIKVSEGDTVEKGDVLFVLDDTDVESAVKSTAASVVSAKQQVVSADSQLISAKAKLATLLKQKNSTKPTTTTPSSSDIKAARKDVEAARLGLSAASAQLSSAQSNYADAVDSRDDLKVKAPCAGTIWSINISKGDSVGSSSNSANSGSSSGAAGATGSSSSSSSSSASSSSSSSAAMTIAKNSQLGVKLSINESDISSIKEGQKVKVTFDAFEGSTFSGTVDAVGTSGTTSSNVVSYSVWVVFDKQDSRLKDGMTASADITVSQESNVLLVSNAAVKGSTGNYYVLYMKSGATTPSQKTVTIGTRGSAQTVIKSGLTKGQKIITQAVTTSSSGDTKSVTGGIGAMAGSATHQGGGQMPSGGAPSGGPGGGN